jgi:hypothetical protein
LVALWPMAQRLVARTSGWPACEHIAAAQTGLGGAHQLARLYDRAPTSRGAHISCLQHWVHGAADVDTGGRGDGGRAVAGRPVTQR